MEKFNRAERRRQTARLKIKRRNYWSGTEADPVRLNKLVQYPQACSCSGCGNARPYYGRTLAEVCHQITKEEFLAEMV